MSKVILHTEESTGWAGQEIRILGEMLGMKGRGYDVLLATPAHTTIFKKASAAGIEIFPVRMNKSDIVRGAFELSAIIRKRGVSLVNTHSSRDSWMGSIAGRMTGAKVIRTRHISSALNKSPLTRLVYGPLCDGIITTGEFIKEQLVRELNITPLKVLSIPTGIDVQRFASADGSKVRAELGLGAGDIVLGTAAALRSWKGHEYLLRAVQLILRDFPEVKLVLAGEGPYRPKVEAWIKELGISGSVFLLGHREDVPEVIKAFDVSLLVSYASEGIPQFVLQSMAAGKPVVGSTIGGIPEVVVDGVNGALVPPRDPHAIADALRAMLLEPETRRRMGEAGHRMALESHTSERMLDSLEELYCKILKA
jgi:glycosyltransferase involved in cell wall biosynthesis